MDEEKKLAGKKISIIGAGVSGRALAELAASMGAEVFISDSKAISCEVKKGFEKNGIAWEEMGNTAKALAADEIVVSSGISPEIPVLRRAPEQGLKVTGELDFLSPFLSGIVIGVTGSNGKTTTTSMLGYYLEKLGYSVLTGGNIGNAAAHAANREFDFIVLELSSFQLHWAESFVCDLAIVTNLAPDHIDWHGSCENYFAAKAKLIKCLVPGGAAIYQQRDEQLLNIKEGVQKFPLRWGEEDPHQQGVYLDDKVQASWINGGGCRMKRKLFTFDEVKLPGRHNLENTAMATAALALFNIPELSPELLGSYIPPKHRCAPAGTISGVTFIDDSKGTNVAATVTALTSLSGSKIIILGGQGKGEDYAPLAAAVKEYTHGAVLLGAEKEKIAAALEAAGAESFSLAKDMEEAVRLAFSKATEGDTVLLSPACTSWDMYPNYNERGEDFCRCVKKLSGEK